MASVDPFPLMPPRSTELRLMHFDDLAYKGDSSTLLYKYVDALCGVTGAGALINQILLARLNGALDTIYFNELDFIFGNVSFLSRSPAESYPWNPLVDMLTAEQWDEVRIKDTWFRERIKDFFVACSLGGTPDGIRRCVRAAIGVDADLFEVWRFVDNFGLGDNLGRAPSSSRSELVIRPHKATLSPIELRLLREMLRRMAPLDTIITISLNGLSVSTPLPISSVAADSSYFEVQKMVTPTPLIADMPAPELLAIDLLPTEQWLFSGDRTLAPYAAFNITQEYGYFYLCGGGSRSPIDSVTYGTLQSDGSVKTEPNFEVFDTTGTWTDWIPWERADCHHNFPGGKFGVHPDHEPALNPDGTDYVFQWHDQAEFVAHKILEIFGLGGLADEHRGYRLPIRKTVQAKVVYFPEYAVAYDPPAKESTVTQSLTRRRCSSGLHEMRDFDIFARH